MTRPRALVVCPGRGSYSKESLGSLKRYANIPRAAEALAAIEAMESWRRVRGRSSIQELDSATSFDAERYLRGENAAALTAAISLADWKAIEHSVRPVAVVGNSMGWYTALGVAGALDLASTARIADEMGNFQHLGAGSQLVYPQIDDNWRPDPEKIASVQQALVQAKAEGFEVAMSIRLGGYAVLAGSQEGLGRLIELLPSLPGGRGAPGYPLRLPQHAAFHTALMRPMSEAGLQTLYDLPWQAPTIPLVDGRGAMFRPRWTDPQALYEYTLGHQVTETYDFSLSLRVALREYAPEVIVVLGPGETLGGPVAQTMIAEGFSGLRQKSDFIQRQEQSPFLLATTRPSVFASLTA